MSNCQPRPERRPMPPAHCVDRCARVPSIGATCITRLCAAVLLACLVPNLSAAPVALKPLPALDQPVNTRHPEAAPTLTGPSIVAVSGPKRAHFDSEKASPEVRSMADWIVDSGDNLNLPFVVVDKVNAKVFVFQPDGRLRGAAPALLGLARGDDSSPGIGDRPLASIRPEQRTTPAGRFVAALGRNFSGKDILWVDYPSAISLHRVVTTNAKERRAQRLDSPTVLDNRISYGCINVPVRFYEKVVSPAFTGTNGIVYVLPEVRSQREVFSAYYDVKETARPQPASDSLSVIR